MRFNYNSEVLAYFFGHPVPACVVSIACKSVVSIRVIIEQQLRSQMAESE